MRPRPEERTEAHTLQGLCSNRAETTAQDVMWRDRLHREIREREVAKLIPYHLLLKHLSFATMFQLSEEDSPQCILSVLEDSEDPAGPKIPLDPSALAQVIKQCSKMSFLTSQGVGQGC